MFKKYDDLTVKSVRKGKNYGLIYDVIVGNKKIKNVYAKNQQTECEFCKYTSKCPYYFNQHINYTPYSHCIYSKTNDFVTRATNIIFFIGLPIAAIYSATIELSFGSNPLISIPLTIMTVLALFLLRKIICLIAGIIMPNLHNFNEARDLISKNAKEEHNKVIIEKKQLTLADDSNKSPISIAKNNVKITKKLYKSIEWAPCNKLIKKYINSLDEILKIVEDDNSAYPRVSSLFETVVPEINNILDSFLELSATGCVNSEVENTLSSTLSKLLQYTEKVKKEAILKSSEDFAIINFKASNDFIRNWIEIK